MKHTTILCSMLLAVMASCSSPAENPDAANMPAENTEATTEAAAPPEVDSATAAQNWMEFMTPGDMHKMMASYDGKWTADMTFWMAEGAPPQTSKGECEFKMIMGGRYQQGMYKSDMNGMPFEGISSMAYDNAKKMFVNTWQDNMGTGIMYGEGPYNEATKSMELKGKMIDPATKAEKSYREIWSYPDANTMVMEMYETPMGGKEYKSMEAKYTRS